VAARRRRWPIHVVVVALSVLGLPMAASAAALTIAWSPSVSQVDGYIVRVRLEAGATLTTRTVVASTTGVRMEGLENGRRYVVWVTAFNAAGESVSSNVVTGTATDNAPLPPGTIQTFFAEGASGFFDYRIALLNAGGSTTSASVAFLREGNAPVYRDYAIAPFSRATISAADVPELNGSSFAAAVTTEPGIVAERTMRWRLGGADGAHTAKSLVAPATEWFLAEGNAGFFDTFVLLANPGSSPVSTTVDFLLDGGGTISRTYTIEGNQRFTIWTNQIPELALQSFATTVRASAPVLVERAMYFRGPNGTWEGGHASAGVTTGALNWFLAEGSTGDFFEMFVLIGNPNESAVTATIQYSTPSGVARTETRTLPASSRTTIPVDTLPGLGNTDVSVSVTATSPVIVERSMYWPGVPGPWHGGHNSLGVMTLGTRWALAEGEIGGADSASSFILLANPGNTTASVTLTFYRSGAGPLQVTRSVPARSRRTVDASTVGLESGERFGVVVTSTQPIAVERSIYWNYLGQLWTSGTNETATAIP
jgi:hypothetical protein